MSKEKNRRSRNKWRVCRGSSWPRRRREERRRPSWPRWKPRCPPTMSPPQRGNWRRSSTRNRCSLAASLAGTEGARAGPDERNPDWRALGTSSRPSSSSPWSSLSYSGWSSTLSSRSIVFCEPDELSNQFGQLRRTLRKIINYEVSVSVFRNSVISRLWLVVYGESREPIQD